MGRLANGGCSSYRQRVPGLAHLSQLGQHLVAQSNHFDLHAMFLSHKNSPPSPCTPPMQKIRDTREQNEPSQLLNLLVFSLFRNVAQSCDVFLPNLFSTLHVLRGQCGGLVCLAQEKDELAHTFTSYITDTSSVCEVQPRWPQNGASNQGSASPLRPLNSPLV